MTNSAAVHCAHLSWVESRRMGSVSGGRLVEGFGLGHLAEEIGGMHAMRGVVRTGVHAARLRLVVAQIAGGGLADYAGFFGAFLAGGENGQLVAHRAVDAERVRAEVAVRTMVGAGAAG